MESASCSLLNRDDYFRAGVTFFDVSDRVGGLRQLIASVDHRSYFPGLDQFAKSRQVVSIDVRNEEFEFWLKNGGHANAFSSRVNTFHISLGAPVMMHLPFGLRTCLIDNNERFPTLSSSRS